MFTCLFSVLMTRSLKPYRFRRRNTLDKTMDVDTSGLYIHVPFCRSLCSFCPYYKEPFHPEVAKEFSSAVLQEAASVARLNRGTRYSSLYFGGGTPALLLQTKPDFIQRLCDVLPVDGDIAVEVHPLDVTPEFVGMLTSAGVGMVSLGVQSFRPELQEALGRTAMDTRPALGCLASADFKTLDVDLIFGIPGQNEDALAEDFCQAVELGATQISTYPFIDFTFARNKRRPLSHRQKHRMLDFLCHTAASLGFERTSVWTFAQAGSQPYSSVTRENFTGLGPSATTLMKDRFLLNSLNLDEYLRSLKSGVDPGGWELSFTGRQRMMYWLFWSLYNLKIDPEAFLRYFGTELDDCLGAELRLATGLGYLEKGNGSYRVTSSGALAFHRVEQIYTRQYIDKTWRIARENNPPEQITLW